MSDFKRSPSVFERPLFSETRQVTSHHHFVTAATLRQLGFGNNAPTSQHCAP
jgi:hypothetical protein